MKSKSVTIDLTEKIKRKEERLENKEKPGIQEIF